MNQRGIPLTAKEQKEVDKALSFELSELQAPIRPELVLMSDPDWEHSNLNLNQKTIRTTMPDPKNWRGK